MPVSGEAVLSEPFPIAEAHGDELEGIIREHSRTVYRIAWSVLRNHYDAEDATQETFVRCLRSRRAWTAARDRRAWLAQTAWRVAIDFYRKGRRRSERAEISLEAAAQGVSRLRATGASADEIAAGREMKALLDRLIEGLPHDLRETLEISLAEELTSAEIGALLGIPEGSVRQRLWKARQILRARFIGHTRG